MHQFLIPREDSTWRIIKAIMMHPPGNDVRACLFPNALVSESPRETRCNKALRGTTLYLHIEETGQDQFQ